MPSSKYAGKVLKIERPGVSVIVMRVTRSRYSLRVFKGGKLVNCHTYVGLSLATIAAQKLAGLAAT